MKTTPPSLFRWSGFVLGAVVASLGFACSSDEAGNDGILGDGSDGSGGRGGGSGGAGPQPAAGSGNGVAGSNIAIPTAGSGSGTAGAGAVDKACATGMAQAKLQPVNMFIQFDRSTSMLEDEKWTQAVGALNGFFQDPAAAGLRVALRFFPHDNPAVGCVGGECGAPSATCCNVEACAQPLVPLGELLADGAPGDMHESALVAAVAASTPMRAGGGGKGGGGFTMQGGTPLFAALGGAVQWAVQQEATNPDQASVVVFVTDGEPNGCGEDIGVIAQQAAAGLEKGVPTYVIGISGVSAESVDQIAMAGGTQRAFFAGGANPAQTQQDLISALNAIRGSVLTCQFAMPTASTAGQQIDPKKINVNYTPGGATTPELIGQSPDGAACSVGGWYYDNDAAPTTISLCEADCNRITADPRARIDVVLGCAVVPAVPR